jgi:tetratricopeptide (TPR) repeat protein
MYRSLLAAAWLTLYIAHSAAAFQDDSADDGWKNLILQGTYADTDQKDHAKAEQIFLKALHEADRFGPDDVRVGATLNKLGLVYHEEHKLEEADVVFRRSLPIFQATYGDESIDVANVNFDIGSVLIDLGKPAAALPFLEKCRASYEKLFSSNSVKIAAVLCMIGDSHRALKEWNEAEAPLKQCAQIREENSGILSADVGDAVNSLAEVYRKEGKYGLADPEYKLAEKIRERTLGIMNPAFADTLEAHAGLLRELGRDKEAEKDERLAAAIRRNQKKSR